MAKYEKWLEPDGLLLLQAWARDGLTNEQIAKKCGISRSTLHEWMRLHSNISDALKKGREVVDAEVENALLKRALGYECNETIIEKLPYGTKTRITTKIVPPDVTAAIFWLKNRKPEVWRDKAQADNREALDKLDQLIAGVNNAAKP